MPPSARGERDTERAELHTYHRLYVGLVLEDLACLIRGNYVSVLPEDAASRIAARHQGPRAVADAPISRGAEGRRRTFSHSLCTSASASCLQFIRLSIQPSSVGMVVGSRAGWADSSVGTRPTSSMFVSMARMADGCSASLVGRGFAMVPGQDVRRRRGGAFLCRRRAADDDGEAGGHLLNYEKGSRQKGRRAEQQGR